MWTPTGRLKHPTVLQRNPLASRDVKSVAHAKNSDIYDIWEPMTIVIFNYSLQTFVCILSVGQCSPNKNVMYVSFYYE